MTLFWSPRALGHLAELRSSLARDNPEAASRVGATILAAVERLARFPILGRPGRVAGTRELVVTATPYVIPYRLRGNHLEIIGVFHIRQKWPTRF